MKVKLSNKEIRSHINDALSTSVETDIFNGDKDYTETKNTLQDIIFGIVEGLHGGIYESISGKDVEYFIDKLDTLSKEMFNSAFENR